MKIQVLDHQGKSIKAIAREIGVSQNTVRKYLGKPDEFSAYKLKKNENDKIIELRSVFKKAC